MFNMTVNIPIQSVFLAFNNFLVVVAWTESVLNLFHLKKIVEIVQILC